MKIVVFDLDGSIVDSIELHAKSFRFAVKKLGYKNYKELYKKYKKFVGIPMEDIVKKIIPNVSNEEIERIKKLKDKYFLENLNKIKAYKRILKILKELKKKNIKINLFTSSPRKITIQILKKLNLKRFFDYIICREDIKNPKPNKEGLIKIMKIFKTKNIIYIGDSKFDELTAKNANVIFMNVKTLKKKNLYKILGMN